MKLAILGIVGIALSATLVFFLTLRRPEPASGQPPVVSTSDTVSAQQAGPGFPVRLRIPKIKVDSAIEPVGLTPQGDVDVPQGPAGVAWFELGPRPGERGTSIIDGHYGWKDNIPAAFDYLYKLQKGDKIYVEDSKGAVVAFVVRELRTYGQNEDTSKVFGSNDLKSHLDLITCGGVWNKSQKSYSDRIVAFADKLEE